MDKSSEQSKDRDREKEKDRKYKGRHASTTKDVRFGKEEREESKKSRRNTSDQRRASRKHEYEFDLDSH